MLEWLTKLFYYVVDRIVGTGKVSQGELTDLQCDVYNAIKSNCKGEITNYEVKEVLRKLKTLEGFVQRKEHVNAVFVKGEIEEWAKKYTSNLFTIYKFFENWVLLAVFCFLLMSFISISHIPSGSMRWAVQETDKILVSTVDFNMRYFWIRKPLLFDESLIRRGDMITWRDRKTPSHSALSKLYKTSSMQLLKRCVAKPGDSVYFYGGNIYIVDKDGNFDEQFLDFQREHNLFYSPIICKNPFAFKSKESARSFGELQHTFFLFGEKIFSITHVKGWSAVLSSHLSTNKLDKNCMWAPFGGAGYFEAQIIEASEIKNSDMDLADNSLVLFLTKDAKISPGDSFMMPQIVKKLIYIPINKHELQMIYNAIDTERFVVKNGVAYSLQEADTGRGFNQLRGNAEDFIDVEDGIYEVQAGQVFKIKSMNSTFGIIPFLSFSAKKKYLNTTLSEVSNRNVKRLFNSGICITKSENTRRLLTVRYGNMYLGRNKLFDRDSDVMRELLSKHPELDCKSEIFNGEGQVIPEEIIKKGFLVPKDHFVMMGDNTQASSDSRFVGCVHKYDLEGKPLFNICSTDIRRLAIPSQKSQNRGVWFFRGLAGLQLLSVMAVNFVMKYYRRKRNNIKKLKLSLD